MKTIVEPVLVIGKDTAQAVAGFCRQRGFTTLQLVADDNTFPILGRSVQETSRNSGIQAGVTILKGSPLEANGDAILQLISSTNPLPDCFVAVGSGTITDVVRYTSFALSRPFISVPTAPSVDAYASPSSPLIIQNIKQSVMGQIALAVFADLPTLCSAPTSMIAAGFGDMLGKMIALADWQLGQLLWDEPYEESIAAKSRADLKRCIDAVDSIAARKESGIRTLFESLFDSGLNMARAGSSRPASGAEHHMAHFWEMKLDWEHRPPIFHGLKVGYACLWAANAYAKLRTFDQSFAIAWEISRQKPDKSAQINEINRLYYQNPARVVTEQKRFLDLTPSDWRDLKAKIVACWPEIQAVAAQVPSRPEIENILARISFPQTHGELGLTKEDITNALAGAHYLRDRFTILKLMSFFEPTAQKP